MSKLKTDAPVSWCPGCGNFEILNSTEAVLEELKSEGFPLEKVVILSGIGNHAKIVDYLHVNSFYTIHGRAIPAAEAIKLADQDVKVICFVGDGDTLAEGLEHLIFAAKRNIDIISNPRAQRDVPTLPKFLNVLSQVRPVEIRRQVDTEHLR